MRIGKPPQDIEVDVDMLSPDFLFVTTSSGQGIKYDVFSSNSRSRYYVFHAGTSPDTPQNPLMTMLTPSVPCQTKY